MQAGKLRTRIQIQERRQQPDGGGGWSYEWVTVYRPWAEWKHQSMFERLHAQQLQSGVMHRVWIRYSDIPTAAHRILYKGKAFQIRAVVNVAERDRTLELQVEEGVAA